MYAICNGKLIDEAEALVPVTRREVFFNFSVYESLKLLEGIPLFAEQHVERFMESAGILGMEHSFAKQDLLKQIKLLIDKNSSRDATIKMQMIGGEEPHLYLFLAPLPRYKKEWYQQGVPAISYPGERIFPHAKSNCLLLNYIAFRDAQRAGALEALLVDNHGYATEGTRSNFYAFKGDTLYTAGRDILYGVTRSLILEAAEANGIPICLEKIPLRKVLDGTFSEPFISSTSMGAMPLKMIDKASCGSSFERVSLLHKAVLERERRELKGE